MGLLTNLFLNIFDTNGLILLFIGFVAAYVYMTRNFGYWKKRQVLEVPPYPFFGNFGKCLLMQKSPERFLQEVYNVGKDEKIIGYYVLDKPILMIREPELIKHVLVKDFEYFSDRLVSASENDPMGNLNLFLIKGPVWQIIRRAMSKFFTSGKMKRLWERMPEVGSDLDEYLLSIGLKDKDNVINVSEMVDRFSIDLVGVATYGIKFNALKNRKSEFYYHAKYIFQASYLRQFQYLSLFFMPQFLKPFGIEFLTRDTSKFLRGVFTETLIERMKCENGNTDFFDLLADIKKEIAENKLKYNFKDDELLAQAGVFYSAGVGTTSLTIIFALHTLAVNIDIQTKLRKDIHEAVAEADGKLTYSLIMTLPYLDAVMSEVLRMFPPLPFVDRVAMNNYQFPGTNITIEKGTPISIPMRAVHMDSKYFPNPEVFQPDRFYGEKKKSVSKYQYFPFGEGQHICIGQRLGLMLTKFCLAYIIFKYELEPCQETMKSMEFNPLSTFLTSKTNLKLKMKAVDKNMYL